MRSSIFHHPWTDYVSGVLILATGGVFAILCILLVVIESILKFFAIPIIFLLGMGVLGFGLIKRVVIHS